MPDEGAVAEAPPGEPTANAGDPQHEQARLAPLSELPPPPEPPPGSVATAEPRTPSGVVATAEPGTSPVDDDEPYDEMDLSLDPTGDSPVTPRRRSYAGEILLVDGIAATSLAIGLADGGSGWAVLGGLGYVFGGPIVHWGHGHAGRGFGSMGLRIGLPLGTLLFASEACDRSCDSAAVGGLVLGAIAAVAIDAGALARERPKPTAVVQVVPTLARDRAGLGLVGAF